MLRPLSKTVPAAVAAILVLAACGSDPTPSEAGSATVDQSSDTASGDGLLAPRPIQVSGNSGGGMSAAAEAAPAADMATDSRMMPYRITTFVAGEGLGELPANDVGYVFQSGVAVTPEQVSALASSLGVTGEPQRIDDGYGVWWRVGPDDGTAPSVTVYEDAQLSWNYSSAWANQAVSMGGGCAVAGSEGSAAVDAPAVDAVDPAAPVTTLAVPDTKPMPVEPVCTEPEPPAGIISADEAESRTRDLMTAVGLDPSLFTFESYGDEWFASASAVEQLDGAFAGRRFDAGFGVEGEMQYASGQMASPAKVGPYPLIDLDTALARLNDPSGFYGGGFGYGGGVATDILARDAVGAVEPAIAPDMAEAPVEAPAGDAMPGDTTPLPEPEQVTVTLTAVEADVWWAWDVDGSVWLLPAYRFIGDDGGWYTVPAVTDEFLVQVPSDAIPVPEPMPVETVPAESVPVDSVPVTDPAIDPALFDSTQLDASVGTTLAEFTAAAEALGATVRVIEIDGVPQAATMDFSTNRVNVAVSGDPADPTTSTVTAIVSVG